MGKKGKKKELDPAELEALRLAEEQERQKMELMKDIVRLKSQCELEEKTYNEFLQEREKINYFWIVEKKTLAEKQSEIRNKEREIQDLEERQSIELKMFQQRLKHLRYHELDELCEMQIDSEEVLRSTENQHRSIQLEQDEDKRTVKIQQKETETSQEDLVRMMKLEQDKKIRGLRKEFEGNAVDLQQQYNQKMKILREDMEKERKQLIQQIEDQKNNHIAKVMQSNQKAFQDIKVYYGDITSSNLDLIKRLKEEHAEIKKRESADATMMMDLHLKNRQLSEPLRKAHADVEKLQEQLEVYEKDKKSLADVKAKIAEKEEVLENTLFQTEILEQQMEMVQKERDEYNDAFTNTIYEVQHKAGLKSLLLEKKLDALEESLEIQDAQVDEVRIAAGVDPQNATHKLDVAIQYKNDMVQELHEEIHKIKESHATIISTYEKVMSSYGIHKDDIGFIPQSLA